MAATPEFLNIARLGRPRARLEGLRLADVRRLNQPLVPAAGSPYAHGGVHGSARCYPLPDSERLNNPNVD